jgi:hypothetical protein
MGAYALYAIACISGLFIVNNQAALAGRLAQGDTSVTTDEANAADNSVGAIVALLIGAFLVLLVAEILWQRNFNKALGKDTARQIRNRCGLRVVWIIWTVLWIGGTVLQTTPSDPQSLVSADHRTMFLLGARALMMVVIAVLTPVVYGRAKAELAGTAVAAPQALTPLGY